MKTSTPSTKIEPIKVVAERINGRAALIGVIALLGAYSATGQIIPGYLLNNPLFIYKSTFSCDEL